MISALQAPKRNSTVIILLLVLAVCGSGAGVMVYQLLQGAKASSLEDASGFDVARVNDSRTSSPVGRAGAAAPSARSSLDMVTSEMEGLQFGAKVDPAPGTHKAAVSLTEAVRDREKEIGGLAMAYTKKHAIIAAYGREWMGYPDLKKLNDDYMRDHDPVKFIKGVAQSKNFGNMVKKYATVPAVQSFVMEACAKADLSPAVDYMQQDRNVEQLISNVASSLGLPPALLAGQFGGGKLDQTAPR